MTRDDRLRIEGYYIGLQVVKASVEQTLTGIQRSSKGETVDSACAAVRMAVSIEADFAAHQLKTVMPPELAQALGAHLQVRQKA